MLDDGNINDLVVELEDLWYCGKVYLPNAAGVFADAATALHHSSVNDSAAFQTPTEHQGTFFNAYTNLRNLIQDQMFVPMANNLIDTGEVLCKIATDYAEIDERASQNLNETIAEHENNFAEIAVSDDENAPLIPPEETPFAPPSTAPLPDGN